MHPIAITYNNFICNLPSNNNEQNFNLLNNAACLYKVANYKEQIKNQENDRSMYTHKKMVIPAISALEAGGAAPSSLEVLLQRHAAADGRSVVVDHVTQGEVDVGLDVVLLRRGRDADGAAAMAAIVVVVVVASHAQLRLRPADGVVVPGEQLHHLNEVKRSGTSA